MSCWIGNQPLSAISAIESLSSDLERLLKEGDDLSDVTIVVADQKFKSSDLDKRIVQMEFEELNSRIAAFSASGEPFGTSGLTAEAVTYKVIYYDS